VFSLQTGWFWLASAVPVVVMGVPSTRFCLQISSFIDGCGFKAVVPAFCLDV
jgi:hypothetical protein